MAHSSLECLPWESSLRDATAVAAAAAAAARESDQFQAEIHPGLTFRSQTFHSFDSYQFHFCVITYNIKMRAQSEDYFETQTKSCSYFLPPLIHLSRVCVDSGNEKL